MTPDMAVIVAVNERARKLLNPPRWKFWLPRIKKGARLDMSRVGSVHHVWELAKTVYEHNTGVDVMEHLRRHEAWLRNKNNAPQLYIDRRG